MSDREFAFTMLAERCGQVLAYRDVYTKEVFVASKNYLFNGCESRKEYEMLVRELFSHQCEIKNELLR